MRQSGELRIRAVRAHHKCVRIEPEAALRRAAIRVKRAGCPTCSLTNAERSEFAITAPVESKETAHALVTGRAVGDAARVDRQIAAAQYRGHV